LNEKITKSLKIGVFFQTLLTILGETVFSEMFAPVISVMFLFMLAVAVAIDLLFLSCGA
jgi:hypothetical protein